MKQSRKHQATEKLAADPGFDQDFDIPIRPTPTANDYWRTVTSRFTDCVNAQLLQGIQQIADRPFAHPRDAVQSIVTRRQSHHRRDESDGGAGVGDKEISRILRNPTRRAVDIQLNCFFGPIDRQSEAQPSQAIGHDLGIFALQNSGQQTRRMSTRESREDQRAIRDAFTPRDAKGSSRNRPGGSDRVCRGGFVHTIVIVRTGETKRPIST
jgi:hypothetical protein